jgi:hypothetical protein
MKSHDAISKSGQIGAFEVGKGAVLSSMAPSTSDKQHRSENMSSGGPLKIDNVHGLCSKMTPLITASRLMTPMWLVTDI